TCDVAQLPAVPGPEPPTGPATTGFGTPACVTPTSAPRASDGILGCGAESVGGIETAAPGASQSSSAWMNSGADWKRQCTSRATAFETMLANAGSRSGTKDSGVGTSDSTILNINWLNVAASKGTWPVTASNSMTPTE